MLGTEHCVTMSTTSVKMDQSRKNLSSPEHRLSSPTTNCESFEQFFVQSHVWLGDPLDLSAPYYLMPLAVRIHGPLHVDALTTALNAVEERHEALRTTFHIRNKTRLQTVHKNCKKSLRLIDISPEQDDGHVKMLLKEQTTPFNLHSEPGWRVALLRLGKEDHILSFVLHSLISDSRSFEILRQEVGQFYADALRGQNPLSQVTPLPMQYQDYTAWQMKEEQTIDHQLQLDYWIEELSSSLPAKLSYDKPQPATRSGNASIVQFFVENPVTKALHDFCQVYHATPSAVLLATFRAVHYRLTGVDDAIIGIPTINRSRPELGNIIGCFADTQCVRTTVEDNETFNSLVRQVGSKMAAASKNKDVPLERIISAVSPDSRDGVQNELVRLLFAFHSQKDSPNMGLEGLTSEPVSTAITTPLDLEFHVLQEQEGLRGSALFATDLFDPQTIRTMVDIFQEVLWRSLKQPQTPLAALLLSDRLLQRGRVGLLEEEKSESPGETRIIDIFREQMAAYPNDCILNGTSVQLSGHHTKIVEIYPATWMQGTFLHNPLTEQPRPLIPCFIDFPPYSDYNTLVKAINALFQYIDILRTVFISVAGTFYQVVLENPKIPIEFTETKENIEYKTQEVCLGDVHHPPKLGEPMIRVSIIKYHDSKLRLIFRMSHALFDGLSLEHLLAAFYGLYINQRLPPPPKFGQYIRHMLHNREDGYTFWRSVLKGSTMPIIKSSSIPCRQIHGDKQWYIEQLIGAPVKANSEAITPANIFTTACGLLLTKQTGLLDVVFGRIVSGRQSLSVSDQHVVGPCTNCIPVRMRVDKERNLKELLQDVQDQYLESLPFETMGLDDIKTHCTEWPDDISNYSYCTTYQGFELQPEIGLADERVRLSMFRPQETSLVPQQNALGPVLYKQLIPQASTHTVAISATPQPDGRSLKVGIAADARIFDDNEVESMFFELASNIRMLNLALQ